ncbi:signal peptidase I [Lachnospiraceae bacterium 47-T17]
MKNFAKSLLGLLLYFLLLFGMIFLLSNYVIGQVQVDGDSMNPTLQNDDRLFVNKFTYRVRDLDRFDIVVFEYAYETDTYYIKRVIGLPGERVRIDADGQIWINDALLEEDYGAETIFDPGIAEEEITLGKDEYFVLGDNRNNSSDSRDPDVGAVDKDQILGNAWLRIMPNFGLLND